MLALLSNVLFFPQENLWIGGQWELFCTSFLLDVHLFLETLLRSYFHKSSMVINSISFGHVFSPLQMLAHHPTSYFNIECK